MGRIQIPNTWMPKDFDFISRNMIYNKSSRAGRLKELVSFSEQFFLCQKISISYRETWCTTRIFSGGRPFSGKDKGNSVPEQRWGGEGDLRMVDRLANSNCGTNNGWFRIWSLENTKRPQKSQTSGPTLIGLFFWALYPKKRIPLSKFTKHYDLQEWCIRLNYSYLLIIGVIRHNFQGSLIPQKEYYLILHSPLKL